MTLTIILLSLPEQRLPMELMTGAMWVQMLTIQVLAGAVRVSFYRPVVELWDLGLQLQLQNSPNFP